ncbi:DUF5719 family protein [Citricoccus sp. GCM10030269]|uniref:DUF5719 family protein n=1 Tax=Citricoccus sp. GCM10030269 TaxID=3273388 RepID=UPI003607DBAD
MTSDEPTSRGQLKRQRAAEARDRKRQAALDAHDRGTRRRDHITAGLAGAGVVVVLAVAVTAGTLAAPQSPQVDGTAAPASLKAAEAQGVCPGPPRLPAGATEGADTEFSPVSTSASAKLDSVLLSDLAGRFPGSTLRQLTADPNGGSGADVEELTDSLPQDVQQGEPAAAGEDGVPVREAFSETIDAPGGDDGQASVVAVEPIGGQAAPADTVSVYSAADGDLAGLDVSSCVTPAHEQWLSGINTSVGSTAVLVLSNPSASASTVDLSLYGAEGPVDAAGTSGIVLAPGQTQSFVLGGMAPDEDHLAVRVSAQGGAVGATVQQHRLFGITPGGVEIIQPTSAPSRTAVMPGLVVPTPEGTEKIVSQDGYEEAGPAVSIAAPGSALGSGSSADAGSGTGAEVTAEVSVNGPDGPVELPDGGVVTLKSGSTVRYPLEGLDRANYTVTVTADAPVVASGQGLSGQAGKSIDVSNVPAVGAFGLERLVARPTGVTSKFVLYSSAGGSAELTPVYADGSLGEKTVQEIGPEQSQTVDMDGLGDEDHEVVGVLLDTVEGQVHAGVAVRTSEGISTYPVVPQTQQSSGLPVRVGY